MFCGTFLGIVITVVMVAVITEAGASKAIGRLPTHTLKHDTYESIIRATVVHRTSIVQGTAQDTAMNPFDHRHQLALDGSIHRTLLSPKDRQIPLVPTKHQVAPSAHSDMGKRRQRR